MFGLSHQEMLRVERGVICPRSDRLLGVSASPPSWRRPGEPTRGGRAPLVARSLRGADWDVAGQMPRNYRVAGPPDVRFILAFCVNWRSS